MSLVNSDYIITLVVALLLFFSSKPLLVGASRLTEFLTYLFGASHVASRRNVTRTGDFGKSHDDIISDTLLKEPLLPALLLSAFQLTKSAGYPNLQDADVALISLLITLAVFIIFRCLSATVLSATRSRLPIAHSVQASCLVIFALSVYAAGLSLEHLIALCITAYILSQVIVLGIRGFRHFGIFCMFWLPFAIFAWICRTFAVSSNALILGPILLLQNIWDGRRNKAPIRSNP